MLKRFLLLFAFLLCAVPLHATNRYVATTGSDAAAGTIVAPYATAMYAYTHSVCGDTIYIRGGTYDGHFLYGRVVYGDQTKTSIALNEINYAATTICLSYAGGITVQIYPGEHVKLTLAGVGSDDDLISLRVQAFDDGHDVHVSDNFWLTIKGEAGNPLEIDGSTMGAGHIDSQGNWLGSGCIGGFQAQRIRYQYLQCHDTSGVAIAPDSSYVEFDYVEEYGVIHTQGGYFSNGHNYLIDHSWFHDNGCYGAQIYEAVDNANVNDNIVRNSIFSTNSYVAFDFNGNPVTRHVAGCGGGLYISSGNRDLVYNNLIYGNGTKGIVISNSMYNAGIYNNTITGNDTGIRSAGIQTLIKNNIAYGNTSFDIDDSVGQDSVISNNFTGVNGDPKFTNAGAGDYTLQSISPAIAYALNLTSSFTTDYAGATRPASGAWDAGAYQSTGVATPALSSVSPISRVQGATSQTITFNAANITLDGTSVPTTNCSGVTDNSHVLVDSLHMTLNISVAGGAAIATCSPSITTTGSPTITLTNGFSITAAATPVITSLTPASGSQGSSKLLTVVAANAHFDVSTIPSINNSTGITFNTPTVSDSNHLTVTITLAVGAAVGVRTITFTTGPEAIDATSAFTVNPATSCPLTGLVPGQCVHKGNSGVASTIVTPALPINVDNTPGHYVGFATLIDKDGSTASNPVTSITSPCGFTYTKVAAGATNLIVQLEIALAPVTSDCSEHPTANYGAPMDFGVGFLREFYGLATSSPKDAEATATGTSAAPSVNIAASVANDVIWSIILSSSAAITATSPATAIETLDNYADELVSPATSGTKTQAFGTSNAFYDVVSVALKPNTITPPSLITASPAVAQRCNPNVTLAITGMNSNFDQTASAPSMSDEGGISAISFTVNSATSATWHFAVACGASLSTRNVIVTTGAEIATGATFTVQPTGGNGRFRR